MLRSNELVIIVGSSGGHGSLDFLARMDHGLKQRVADLVKEPLVAEGYELADIVLSRYKANVTLKLFVYGENGVSLGACAHLSRIVGDLIEETDMFEGGYSLEVSSPGLDRPLTTVRDFKYRIGETVKIRFVEPKKKKVSAEIVAVTDDTIEFRNNTGTFTVPIDELEEARIIF